MRAQCCPVTSAVHEFVCTRNCYSHWRSRLFGPPERWKAGVGVKTCCLASLGHDVRVRWG